MMVIAIGRIMTMTTVAAMMVIVTMLTSTRLAIAVHVRVVLQLVTIAHFVVVRFRIRTQEFLIHEIKEVPIFE